MATDLEPKQIVELERRFWEAMQRKDGAATERMTAERCLIVGAQGVSAIDNQTMAKLTVEGAWTLESFEFDPQSIKTLIIGDDMAAIAYKVREDVIVDGKKLTLEANDSSLWVKENGDWHCAMHTESVAGDPFGRDSKAQAPT